MSFRERPEYAEWRQRVTQIFGDKCIMCGYGGNIHVHHVLPVHTYPELAFDPQNGVPLCGNCHSEVSGQESAHVGRLRELQKQVLKDASADGSSIDDLRKAAEGNPSDPEAVTAWLASGPDSEEAIRFYVQHQRIINPTALLALYLVWHLRNVGRFSDAIKFADAAMVLAREEGNISDTIRLSTEQKSLAFLIALGKAEALCALSRHRELVPYIEALVAENPNNGDLHWLSFVFFLRAGKLEPGSPLPDTVLEHVLRAADLCPQEPVYQRDASTACLMKGRLSDALRYAKQQSATANSIEDKTSALGKEANVYQCNDLYDDAIKIYREILRIDGNSADAMANIAHCLFMLDRIDGARDMAKRSLLLDPGNEMAKSTLAFCEKLDAKRAGL